MRYKTAKLWVACKTDKELYTKNIFYETIF